MQKWEEVEDVETLRETAAKLGVEGAGTMDREQLIEALDTAEVPDGQEGSDQAKADAESAFGGDGTS